MPERTRTLIETSWIFSGLPGVIIDRLTEVASRRTVPAGSYLFRQGTPREAFYLILEGELQVIDESGTSPQQLIVLGPNEGVGEGTLLGSTQHSTTGFAKLPLEVLELRGDEVREVLQHDARAAIEVLTRVALEVSRRLQFSSSRSVGLAQDYMTGELRQEHDLLGDREVPADALYGIQTLRAVENFNITGIRLSHFPAFGRALAMVKQASARTNVALGFLEPEIGSAIDRAAQEIIDGHWHGHLVVDMVQGGAGTSTNMNINEVIANRALELTGHDRGDYVHCHPNNHVNLSQSTNDVYPTAIRVALTYDTRSLVNALEHLTDALSAKAEAFDDVIKMGRTQLQDAVPMTLGQELAAFAATTQEDILRLRDTSRLFLEVNLGGTAIGTSINADPRYPRRAVRELRAITGLDLSLAENLVEATPDTGAFVSFSGVLKRAAVKLSKMCNDLRLLSSGPRCGLNEINLPAMQPGSSIMPGKVNPVIPEVVNQVAFHVIGNDLAITLAAEAGQLQLNVMEPIIAFNLFQSIEMLTAAVNTLTQRCIQGITANVEHCREMVEGSIGLVTALVPVLGYEGASEVAKEALSTGRSVRAIVLERGLLDGDTLNELLAAEAMTRPRRLTS
jgi:aspartate ammonia-lyase